MPTGLTNVTAIASGRRHNLALTGDGRVIAWGDNSEGQTDVPASLTNVVSIAAGSMFSLALKADGTVVAWGQYGDNTPLLIPSNLSNVKGVWGGDTHCLALKADGTVVAWGHDRPIPNNYGITNVPADLTNVTALSAGWRHNLALRANGTVAGWGDSFLGESSPPPGLTNVIAICAGNAYFSESLRSDGEIVGWGGGSGGGLPLFPGDLTNVVAISAGGNSCLALKADGTVAVWGSSVEPLPPSDITGVTAISAASGELYSYLALAATPQGKPVISFIGPLTQSVSAGSQAFFSVAANGSAPFSYQWYFGTNAIAGATNRWLALYNVSQSGSFTVVVSNAIGSATSPPVLLNVIPVLDINMVPAITLKGAAGQTFRLDYINAVGPTNAWTTLATVTLTSNQQFYSDYSAIGQPVRLYRLVQLP
jgi:hypothetical protein